MTYSSGHITAENVAAASRALIRARQTNLGIEVQMPIVYPGGQAVTVVVSSEGATYQVHDAGFGAMYLSSSGIKLTEKLQRRFSDLAANYGCEFIEGRMSMRCSEEHVATAIALVANASRVVGDHVANAKRQSIIDFKREVSSVAADVLGSDRVRNDEEFIGESGTPYRLNIVILSQDKSQPIAFIETLAEQNAVNSRFRAFYDIRQNDNLGSIHRVSIYDDRHEWRAGDLVLLQDVSNLIPFSGARARIDRLAA